MAWVVLDMDFDMHDDEMTTKVLAEALLHIRDEVFRSGHQQAIYTDRGHMAKHNLDWTLEVKS